jgi:hypothetical protein
MTDDDFLAAFEEGGLPKESFHHRDHVRVVWLCLRQAGLEAGSRRFVAALRRFAERHGVPGLYHETLTRAWIHLVWAALEEGPAAGFEAFLLAHPRLGEKDALRDFYSPERLASPAARAAFLEPDLAPLPERIAVESAHPR